MNISNNFMKNKMTMFQRRRSFEMHGKVWMFSDLIDDEDMELNKIAARWPAKAVA